MQQLIQHVICPKAILTLAQRAIKQALRESWAWEHCPRRKTTIRAPRYEPLAPL